MHRNLFWWCSIYYSALHSRTASLHYLFIFKIQNCKIYKLKQSPTDNVIILFYRCSTFSHCHSSLLIVHLSFTRADVQFKTINNRLNNLCQMPVWGDSTRQLVGTLSCTQTQGAWHTPSIAFRHPPLRKDVVNQCLEFGGMTRQDCLKIRKQKPPPPFRRKARLATCADECGVWTEIDRDCRYMSARFRENVERCF